VTGAAMPCSHGSRNTEPTPYAFSPCRILAACDTVFSAFPAQPAARNHLPVEVLTISTEAPERHVVDYAASFIKRGRVVGVPTDTFYGLSADPFNLSAIERVFQIKGRAETKALPILVNSIEQAVTLVRDVPDQFLNLAHKLWPGALTMVLKANHRLPLKVTGNSGNVALRWPNSRVITALIEASDGPITGTSANLSGFPSCTNAQQIVKQLGDRLSLILDSGDTGGMLASTIVRLDGEDWSIVREGALSEDEIRRAAEN
jgi:tRNA threonylcarbamoyl adenosine modification protein (Sua5/YciO/YrdC/YwlC family)